MFDHFAFVFQVVFAGGHDHFVAAPAQLPLSVSLRPEGFRLGESGDAPNILTGKIEITEYIGMTVDYIVRVGDHVLDMTFVSSGAPLLRPGDEIRVAVPESSLYLMPEGKTADIHAPNLSTRRLSVAKT